MFCAHHRKAIFNILVFQFFKTLIALAKVLGKLSPHKCMDHQLHRGHTQVIAFGIIVVTN